ncbi:hypothetical protein AVEN_275088-1 [Araneus ventricosus]|uniref:Uncharacterized protein n=1 Tax=Araneus ventricosus TaxID=182803 RepID=A0A4Y2WE88_ARAVE|nr:hypothetical protein AVEN_275088-1 [Araneus ventricosus]
MRYCYTLTKTDVFKHSRRKRPGLSESREVLLSNNNATAGHRFLYQGGFLFGSISRYDKCIDVGGEYGEIAKSLYFLWHFVSFVINLRYDKEDETYFRNVRVTANDNSVLRRNLKELDDWLGEIGKAGTKVHKSAIKLPADSKKDEFRYRERTASKHSILVFVIKFVGQWFLFITYLTRSDGGGSRILSLTSRAHRVKFIKLKVLKAH